MDSPSWHSLAISLEIKSQMSVLRSRHSSRQSTTSPFRCSPKCATISRESSRDVSAAQVDVNGPHTHAVFSFLKQHLSRVKGHEEEVGFDLPWNFQKFLVDRDGMPLDLFPREFVVETLEPAIVSLLHSEQ